MMPTTPAQDHIEEAVEYLRSAVTRLREMDAIPSTAQRNLFDQVEDLNAEMGRMQGALSRLQARTVASRPRQMAPGTALP
jgi:hypothetical protein